jgi:hypothetical protein
MRGREFIGLSPGQMWKMKTVVEKALNIDLGNKCKYCGKVIKKGTKFGIFNKPNRLVCNDIICISECIVEDE